MGLVPGARERKKQNKTTKPKQTVLEERRQEGAMKEGKSRKGGLLTSKAHLSTEALGCM